MPVAMLLPNRRKLSFLQSQQLQQASISDVQK